MPATVRQQVQPADEPDIEPPEEAVEQEAPATEAPNTNPSGEGWLAILQADTPDDEVHSRPLQTRNGPVMKDGQPVMLPYVTARFVQERLDAAVGPANWQSAFTDLPNTEAVRCGIGIRPPDSDEWVWKFDIGTPSSIEPQKGAHSDAFKRAGVQWGIARDLYDERDGVENIPAPAPTPVQQQPVAQAPMQAAPQPPPGITYAEAPQQQALGQMPAQWACPIHDDVKIVPAGVSRRTGRPYKAFYACPVAGCDQKGSTVPGQ